MFDYFRFSLPRAVTEQLVERLDQLHPTPLTEDSVVKLQKFQSDNESTQGVYIIYLNGAAVYAGKSDHLAERLGIHLGNLAGRTGIDPNLIGFKALLLDENWSTSANEGLLINHFKARNECRWNGSGFGPKDPGKNRDGSQPSWFDNSFPIRDDYPIEGITDQMTISALLNEIKAQVPYLFRFDLSDNVKIIPLNLNGVPRTARALVLHAAQALGKGWQLMLFKNGFTLYRANKEYAHGSQLFP
jgi:hypothetical protein